MKKQLTILLIALSGVFSVMISVAGNGEATTNPASGKLEKPLHIETNLIRSPGIFTLDHFKVYQIEPQPAGAEVRLRGQFDIDTGHQPARLLQYEKFLNPVSKNNEPIIDKNRHLNWYLIEAPDEPVRQVSFYNQFGLQNITIGNAKALLVPTEKVEPGSVFPQGLDHYKVYEVLSAQNLGQGVILQDQFGTEQNSAYIAAYFAVPVEKVHNGKVFPINNPEDHIVFYRLDPRNWNEQRPTIDQFGNHEMFTLWSELLGVPTHKMAWQEL